MFVITADQIDSRGDIDRVPEALSLLEDLRGEFATRSDRTAGDELQVVTASPAAALEVVLRLSRTERWSVGVGVGAVREPLPRMAREATGPAFLAAREAVGAAKRRQFRFALRVESVQSSEVVEDWFDGDQATSLVELLIALRDRRSPEGWEVCDLMATGIRQSEAAERLGVTPQAVSLRLRAAGWRLEQESRPALALVLDAIDRSSSERERVVGENSDAH